MTNSGAVAVVLSPFKEKKQLFPERSHFHRRARFCTNGTILCVCSHDHYYSMYLSILQVLQACVQDEEKKNAYTCVSNGDASYTAPKYKYKTPKHQ